MVDLNDLPPEGMPTAVKPRLPDSESPGPVVHDVGHGKPLSW